jgi:hypothetical protein
MGSYLVSYLYKELHPSQISLGGIIGRGSAANVYSASLSLGNKNIPIAFKKLSIDTESISLTEMRNYIDHEVIFSLRIIMIGSFVI